MKPFSRLLALGALLPSALFAQQKSPNIVMILIDDLGWSSLSTVMDDKYPASKSDYYQTPNIDRLASQSMRFTNGYAAAAVSSPTRYSIQTGETPARIGHVKVGQNTDKIDHAAFLTIPKMLKQTNPQYVTAHFGKWHIGCDPSVMGYDFSDGETGNSEGGYKQGAWLDITFDEDPKLVKSLTQRSMDFMEKQNAAGKPFYLQLSHYATHMAFVETQESYGMFNALPAGEKHHLATFAAMLYDMDKTVGQLLAKIDELGIGDNTYVILLADNGGVPSFPPGGAKYKANNCLGENAPLQRGKWDLFEGGIRVPFMVRGPQIKPNSFCDVPVVSYDIMPTLADIVGYAGQMPQDIDGISFKPALLGSTAMAERPLYFHSPYVNPVALARAHSAMRLGDYKLIKYWDNNQVQLFDLRKDISEMNDISSEQQVLANKMGNMLDNYLKAVNAPTPEEFVKNVSPQKGAQKKN